MVFFEVGPTHQVGSCNPNTTSSTHLKQYLATLRGQWSVVLDLTCPQDSLLDHQLTTRLPIVYA